MRLFLDVFAGTGALSAEALSRGASCAFLLEREPNALRILRRNLETAGFARDRWRVLPGDALACLRRLRRQGRTFDVIFLDPPYASGLGGKALLGLASLLEPDGVAILEHEAKKSPPEVSDLRLVETRKFGDTAISFFQRRGGD
ncbi:MAG: RsmD family RNA methyltransferase [Nitrospinota bacterium]